MYMCVFFVCVYIAVIFKVSAALKLILSHPNLKGKRLKMD